MAKTTLSELDEYGFKRACALDYAAYEEITTNYYKTLIRRRKKWENAGKTFYTTKSVKLKRYIRKGIPVHIRSDVWMRVSGGFDEQQRFPELYKNLLRKDHDVNIVESIRIDLPRTFPENALFGIYRRPLFNVLIAFASYDPDIGYCQGLNYIAGLLLIVTKDEERTFWLLKMLIKNITNGYYNKSMVGLIKELAVLKRLLLQRAPQLYYHIDNLGMTLTTVTTKWFVCMFAEVLPVETTLRIWDCLFLEGRKILFRVSITLFMQHKDAILACDEITLLAELFRTIVKDANTTNCHTFMENIFRVPGRLRRRDIQINTGTIEHVSNI